MTPVRVGFVGGGEHARMSLLPSLRHALGGAPSGLPALVASHAGARLPPLLGQVVALAEHKRDCAERIAAFHGIPQVFTDHEEMLAQADLDCVLVCLHPRLQPDVAIACLDAGKHVFVEKPQAETLADSLRIREAAERNGKRVAVAFMKRFSEPYLRARRILQLPAFGPPSIYEARFTYGRYTRSMSTASPMASASTTSTCPASSWATWRACRPSASPAAPGSTATPSPSASPAAPSDCSTSTASNRPSRIGASA